MGTSGQSGGFGRLRDVPTAGVMSKPVARERKGRLWDGSAKRKSRPSLGEISSPAAPTASTTAGKKGKWYVPCAKSPKGTPVKNTSTTPYNGNRKWRLPCAPPNTGRRISSFDTKAFLPEGFSFLLQPNEEPLPTGFGKLEISGGWAGIPRRAPNSLKWQKRRDRSLCPLSKPFINLCKSDRLICRSSEPAGQRKPCHGEPRLDSLQAAY